MGDLGCSAIVLTYRRPRLATAVVRGLIEREGLAPSSLLLVVNGEGGLEDPTLERAVEVLRLPSNTGPAGGFRAGLVEAHRRIPARWYYVCEDDVGLFDLPTPRLAPLVAAADTLSERGGRAHRPVGAIVAYGRDLDRATGLTVPHRPVAADGFEPVDVAAWGASLVAADVLDAEIWPDDRWFFGFEDFDFWLRLQAGGFRVLLDVTAARALDGRASERGRAAGFAGQRPSDRDEEPWRSYYHARNFVELRRRHGTRWWTVVHLIKTLRRAQLAGGWAARRAMATGLLDGFRGILGPSARYQRDRGEL